MTRAAFLKQNLELYFQLDSVKKSPSTKSFSALSFIAALVPALAFGQNVQNVIIDPSPPGVPLEKTLDYFTSDTIPSIILGSSSGNGGLGGYYLYQSANGLNGPWTMTTIDSNGDAYERMRAFTWPGDSFPGVMASRSGQLVWYLNPINWGGDTTQPWPMEVINPNAGCHDLRIVDVEQSGFPAVVCSSTFLGPWQDLIAFNNGTYDSWTIRNNPFVDGQGGTLGDSIYPLSVNGGPRINVVGASENGIFWWENPALTGGNPRTDPWPAHYIGGANTGASGTEIALATVNTGSPTEEVIAGSGEESNGPWTQGLVWFHPGSDPRQPWTAHQLDSSYRAIHEMNDGSLGSVPYVIVAEQEQAGGPCNVPGWNVEHPGLPSRAQMFQWNGSGFSLGPELSTQGTQNQQAVPYGEGILVAGANHGVCGTPYKALQAWYVASGNPPPPGSLPNGTYGISAGGEFFDGGFGYWGYPVAVQFYPRYPNDTGQEWVWNGSTFENVLASTGGQTSGPFMADNGDGTVTENASGDMWTVTALAQATRCATTAPAITCRTMATAP
jgi:hypothetical protein